MVAARICGSVHVWGLSALPSPSGRRWRAKPADEGFGERPSDKGSVFARPPHLGPIARSEERAFFRTRAMAPVLSRFAGEGIPFSLRVSRAWRC